jgi:hypothetical protein
MDLTKEDGMSFLAEQRWADDTWHGGETFDNRTDAEAYIAIQSNPANWRIVKEDDDEPEFCIGCERMIDKGVSGNCPVCDAEHVFEDDA